MADAAESAAWDRTSAIMTTILNVNRGRGQSPYRIDHFNPFKKTARMPVISAEELKAVFIGNSLPERMKQHVVSKQ